MSCCGGNKSAKINTKGNNFSYSSGSGDSAAPVYFEKKTMKYTYVGSSNLTIISPVTGRRYSFTGNGVTLSVDPKDKVFLNSVPKLKAEKLS